MKKHLTMIAAAAMMAGGLTLSQWTSADEPPNPNPPQQTGQPMENGAATQPGGVAMGTTVSPSANQVRSDLARMVQAALSRNPMTDLHKWFSRADRDRLGTVGESSALSGTVRAFRRDWRSRYNQSFDIGSGPFAAAHYQILQGQVGEMAQPAGGQMAPGQQPPPAPGETRQTPPPGQGMAPAATDRNHATVIIPADPAHGLPQLTLHLVNEGTIAEAWRLELPSGVAAGQLQSNLKDHLYALGQAKPTWPNDPNQGYQLVAHHVFAALENIPVQASAPMVHPG